ncbi:hypothetical protein BWI17_04550 [Betaproteobacteria bacterium GR16-43]|nr:hypothetical protein BWI17_04550 [Betaproteobacteria bacterium GR16-43]
MAAKETAVEKVEVEARGGGRSASYPSINLETAVNRAKQFWDGESKYEAPLTSAFQHWGYGPKSSGARLTVAAMLNFGLMTDRGANASRLVKLTPLGVDLMMAPNADFRVQKLKETVQKPKVFADLLRQFDPKNLPSNQTIAHYLVTVKGFNPSGAEACIKSFRESIRYAQLVSSDILPSTESAAGSEVAVEANPPNVRIGSLIQWESGGVVQFQQPRRVVGFSDDGKFAFVEGEGSGVPIGEVTVMEAKPAVPVAPTPAAAIQQPVQPTRGFKQDVYNFADGGSVILQWPEGMSKESFEEFQDWIELQLRKIKRASGL